MSMMREKSLKVLLLFLVFCCVLLSVTAIPATRSLKSKKDTDFSVQELVVHQGVESKMNGDMFEVGEGFFEGRMNIETNDYAQTGANSRHLPGPPARRS